MLVGWRPSAAFSPELCGKDTVFSLGSISGTQDCVFDSSKVTQTCKPTCARQHMSSTSKLSPPLSRDGWPCDVAALLHGVALPIIGLQHVVACRHHVHHAPCSPASTCPHVGIWGPPGHPKGASDLKKSRHTWHA
eukprot:1142983-Pelagomonas_calceolata.AAC.1